MSKASGGPRAQKPSDKAEIIEEGDFVTVGDPAPGKVVWEIEDLPRQAAISPFFPRVRLRGAGRTRVAALGDLRLDHKKGSS